MNSSNENILMDFDMKKKNSKNFVGWILATRRKKSLRKGMKKTEEIFTEF